MTVVERLTAALAVQGFHEGWTFQAQSGAGWCFRTFTRGAQQVLLQVYQEGGCVVWTPLVTTTTVADALAAIRAL